MPTKQASWNPKRVLLALGRMGYNPVSAILDIVDNSVSAEASQISIDLVSRTENREGPGRRRQHLEAVRVSDNGCGMSEEKLTNALSLGSSEDYYREGTLSKFGMGLKSAASSLGSKLEILTRDSEQADWLYACVDQSEVGNSDNTYHFRYEQGDAAKLAWGEEEPQLARGTHVRVSEIHTDGMASPSDIEQELRDKSGVTYYYFLAGAVPGRDQALTLLIGGESVAPRDPLFAEEIDSGEDNHSLLDESSWDGLRPKWIRKESTVSLSDDGQVTATVEMAQMPHPPSCEAAGQSRAEVRDRFMIGSGNYGFFIYRNWRLIAWGDHLDLGGKKRIVPYAKNLYAFRGRILFQSDADEALNLDVAKSRVILTQVANDQLVPEVHEATKASRNAWDARTVELKRLASEDSHTAISDELSKAAASQDKSDKADEQVASGDQRERMEDARKKEESKETPPNEKVALDRGERVTLVPTISDNQLWARALHPERGFYAKLNTGHRLYESFVQGNEGDLALMAALESLVYSLARGEWEMVYKSDFDEAIAETFMEEYRSRVSDILSDVLRRMDLTALLGDND